MNKSRLWLSIACFIVAAAIFIFASGARRIYSGALFTLLGGVSLVSARGSNPVSDSKGD